MLSASTKGSDNAAADSLTIGDAGVEQVCGFQDLESCVPLTAANRLFADCQ